jgi:diguanylate cyclase (GGDEF)-like protein
VLAVGPTGLPARTVAIAHDCTEQKAAEAALRENEEMLRLSLDIGRVAAYRVDYQTRMLHCGLQGRLFLGLPTNDLDEPITMADFFATIVPEDRPGLIAALAAAQAAQLETTFFAYRINHPRDGVREFESRSRMTYDAQGQPLESIGVAIDVTERGEAEARIAHMAHHDPLTELPNRTLFNVRLSEALARARRGEQFALFCLDLDRFKDINDTLGHPIGDALLRAVTDRLRAGIRPTDTLARMGGDEFALIQSRLEQPGDAIALAERLIAALQEPFELEGYHVTSGSSIGIAVAPDDGTDGDSLLRRADMALYAAKAEGRGRFRLFERHMDAELQARRTLELDLRQALARDEFVLFYQPLVRAADGTLSGFEALLRWQHPTRGLVPPDQFIPKAESAGLLVPIGAWVLRDACIEAARWPHRARVAVNLSAMQVTGEALVDTVLAALRESGLDPKRLELEITETAMLQDTEVTLATLHELKALGVSIAMDDFGTGYSSLSYLQRFPFDKVKIDRSFTTHLGTRRESAAIVSAVIDLCGSLDMRTTAEGVETAAQFDALARIGCTEAQGYYFSRPRPAADIPAMIARVEELARQQPAVAAEAGGQDLWLRA